MNRRDTIGALLAIGAMAAPSRTPAQAKRRFRVGLLAGATEAGAKPNKDAFVAGLRDLGYEAGRNLDLDIRYAGEPRRYEPLIDELIALKPDVLVGVDSVAVVMKTKTSTIPIVLLTSTDPVADGLVRSLARPGMNVTGLADLFEQIVAKHIELLVEIVPKIARIALFDFDGPTNRASSERFERYARNAATAKGLQLTVVRAGDSAGLRQAFAMHDKDPPGGIVVAARVETFNLRDEIVRYARRLRVPTISALPPQWSEDGGLLNYGPNFRESYRHAASFVDRIFKGMKPADLPVEQITKYSFVVNLKAAREIGVTIPASVMLRADRVIE